MFGYMLTEIANVKNNYKLYYKVKNFYDNLKPAMIKRAQDGDYYIACLIYDFTDSSDSINEALNCLNTLAKSDGLEIRSNYPESSLVNIVW